VADDLVQRLLRVVALTTMHGAETIKEAAYALARKDAEIAAANAEIDELVRALKLCTQRAERAEARVREAPVVEAEPFRETGSAGSYPYAAIALTGETAKRIGGKRVALVLLDTEEAK
jgi:hypothetical protein